MAKRIKIDRWQSVMQAEDIAELIIAQLKLNRRYLSKTVAFGLLTLNNTSHGKILKTINFNRIRRQKSFTGFLIDYSDDWILLQQSCRFYVVDMFYKNKNVKRFIETKTMNLLKGN
jgi:hypothetical protein